MVEAYGALPPFYGLFRTSKTWSAEPNTGGPNEARDGSRDTAWLLATPLAEAAPAPTRAAWRGEPVTISSTVDKA
ncbi:hypothetical protein GWI33_007508 [Rhynchophorus ferrugineus]|uniref:Uncharacterized protein n=1 Tax=Rhynchophorus ferrugineus TaxID=354439 RepID=A0A834MEU6_RHYFE|nr:hypothetical protein GWI33_007508 [Rhynchophorus ferrugineus]